MKLKLISMLMLLLLLAACSSGQNREPAANPDSPAGGSDADSAPEDTGGDSTNFVIGEANVDEVGVNLMESFPVQVSLTVRGFLTDGCTELDETTVTRTDSSFDVRITTRRQADLLCTQQLAPFEETVSLDVAGLPAGEYTVDVNGVTTSFTLDMDNVLPDDGDPAGKSTLPDES